MLGFGHTPELIALVIIAVLIFGPKRLPEIGSALGRTISSFRTETRDLRAHAESLHGEVSNAIESAGTPPPIHREAAVVAVEPMKERTV
jgi:sec-independent protein translocase protein TatA